MVISSQLFTAERVRSTRVRSRITLRQRGTAAISLVVCGAGAVALLRRAAVRFIVPTEHPVQASSALAFKFAGAPDVVFRYTTAARKVASGTTLEALLGNRAVDHVPIGTYDAVVARVVLPHFVARIWWKGAIGLAGASVRCV